MPLRDNPSARQVRLGSELRKLRESAGRTAREAAGLLSTDQAKISHIEAGRLGISEERVRRLAVFYSCDDTALIDALCAITRESRGQGWWEAYRGVLAPGFLDVAELEHHATSLRALQPMTLPGVFQTEDYTRAVYGGHIPVLPAEEVDVRVEFRQKRRQIFERDVPPPFVMVIHEAALRMRVGGRKVARAQLVHLLEVSERPAVTLRVIPFTSEEFVEATQPVLYAGGVVPRLDTVQVDSVVGGILLDGGVQLKKYGTLLDLAERAALDEEGSRRFVHDITREL
ncbi:helix-turn-helix domain-containing protein [Streptomyces antibioticus]|uniref:DNA-binding protein n=1 Tax=Streptomyces antibioticus TaxID=1890 RepID=A0AAE6Y992_STRAT|nr:helix-turn-helix transcriptional regulator [Streptomyces antibioticus]OOQ51099.1 DNA-binding protein [Streptomyces antibioticus]QIT45256.1 helix-turn-helix domain-containing protein [Streptomyces antibioticus]